MRPVVHHKSIWIAINISLSFVPKGPIDNIPALVQIMAWRRSGDKPSSGPMMVRLPTHICVTRPQWVNTVVLCLEYYCLLYNVKETNSSALAMELCLFYIKPLLNYQFLAEPCGLFTHILQVDSLVLGQSCNLDDKFWTKFSGWWLGYLWQYRLQMKVTGPYWW